jgi:hypothetical protein
MDCLEQAKSRPLFVEEAVRTALRDAVAWRIGGGQAPSVQAFIGAAIASARIALDAIDAKPGERSRTLTAVRRVAERFTRAALYRRVMQVPAARFVRLARDVRDADVIVRDRRRRLHAIVLTVARDAFDAGQIATRIALTTSLGVGDRLNPLTIHVFSLGTGHRLTFERDVFERPPDRGRTVRVA